MQSSGMLFPYEDLTGLITGSQPIVFPKISGMFQDEFDLLTDEQKGMYEYDEQTRTYFLPDYEWLNWRDHGPFYYDKTHPYYQDVCLGGSDVGALLNGSSILSKYHFYDGQTGSSFKCAAELFYEKSGIPFSMEEEPNAEVLWAGHNEEDAVARMFKYTYEKDHPQDAVKLISDTHMYRSSVYPFMQCDLDYKVSINGIIGVLECKTCNYSSPDYKLWKQGICPLKYYAQVQWYLICADLPYAYICCKWGNLPADSTYIFIKRDIRFGNELVALADKFVGCIRTGTEPSLVGESIRRINILWRKKSGPIRPDAPIIKLRPEMADAVRQLKELNEEIKEHESLIQDLKNKRMEMLSENIFPVFGESTKGSVVDPVTGTRLYISLKDDKRGLKLDETKLKKEEPEIYSRYIYRQTKFNTGLFKKENPQLVSRFLRGDTKLTDAKMNYCDIYEK